MSRPTRCCRAPRASTSMRSTTTPPIARSCSRSRACRCFSIRPGPQASRQSGDRLHPPGGATRPLQVKIVGIELTGLLEPFDVGNGQPMAGQLDQSVLAKLLERAVDMDRGQAGRIAEILLRRRGLAAVGVGLAE